MRIRSVAVLTLAATAALAVSACGSIKQGIGLTKVVPDEFVTVSTAPLSVPPEYGLRPPAPGQPRPQELAPESAARQILLGQRQAVTRTPGEQVLVAQAGDIAHKDESFANRLMFWRKDDASTQAPTVRQTSEGQTTIDATTEAARLQALTGGQQAITITPRRSGGFKLPGL